MMMFPNNGMPEPAAAVRLEAERAAYDGPVARHVHTSFEMMLVLRGYGTWIARKDAVFLTPGSLLAVKPGNPHQLADCSGMDVLLCRFSSDLLLAQSRGILGAERVRALVTHHVNPDVVRLTEDERPHIAGLMERILSANHGRMRPGGKKRSKPVSCCSWSRMREARARKPQAMRTSAITACAMPPA